MAWLITLYWLPHLGPYTGWLSRSEQGLELVQDESKVKTDLIFELSSYSTGLQIYS